MSRSRPPRLLRTHQWIYQTTHGFLGRRLLGVPTLLLTTTGRRTGAARTTALVYAKATDGTLVVTASNGGDDRRPGWTYNVADNPTVRVQLGRRTFDAVGEVVRPGDNDYAHLWALVNHATKGRYDRYQRRTARRFDLVRLRPTT